MLRPEPVREPDAGTVTTPLGERLAARIVRDGPLTVADYMQACLADPAHGYYATRDPLGVQGDFVTAPEISQMFGELIGLWCVEVWRSMGAPSPFRLIELGPGRGTLLADALRAAALVPDFGAAARLHLVETSPVLRDAQRQRLGPHAPTWHDALEDVPAGPSIVIANEFLDALPVRQFVKAPQGWAERCVTADAHGFAFGTAREPLGDETLIPPAVRAQATVGDIAEIRPAADGVVRALAERCTTEPLAALIVDYGHVHSAPGDTLQAVAAHGFADPLGAPGAQDLTAHVDFAALAQAARDAGLAVHGPLEQGPFLLALGLAERCERLMQAAGNDTGSIESAARRLVEAHAMGTLFKAMALTRPGLPAPPPFAA